MDMKQPFKIVKSYIDELLWPPAPAVYSNANQNENCGDGNVNNNPNINFGSNCSPVVTFAPVTNVNSPAPNPSVCDIHDF